MLLFASMPFCATVFYLMGRHVMALSAVISLTVVALPVLLLRVTGA